MTKLYLDDVRNPMGNGFIIVRSFQAFVIHIESNGMPNYISFDHDIASYSDDGTEQTGLDAAKFVVDYCMDNDIPCPDFNVHSANPVGGDNIRSMLNNFKKHQASEL